MQTGAADRVPYLKKEGLVALLRCQRNKEIAGIALLQRDRAPINTNRLGVESYFARQTDHQALPGALHVVGSMNACQITASDNHAHQPSIDAGDLDIFQVIPCNVDTQFPCIVKLTTFRAISYK